MQIEPVCPVVNSINNISHDVTTNKLWHEHYGHLSNSTLFLTQKHVHGMKSIYGYIVYVGGNAVQWKSKKAQTTATSSTIAKLDAIYHCATDCKWIGEFLISIGVKKDATFHIYSESVTTNQQLKC
jgi:hypothetical protein